MRSLALLALVASTPLAAQGVTPPGGGAPIHRHPAKDIVALFDRLCVRAPEDALTQETLARELKFLPVAQPRGIVDMHRRSISFSLRDTPRGRSCAISGLTDRAVPPEEIGTLTKPLKPRASRVFALSADRQDAADTTQVVLRLLTPHGSSESSQ